MQEAGLERSAGLVAVDDELVGQVVAAVRPARPNGHGAGWEALLAHEEQITAWVAGDGKDAKPLSIVKTEELLTRAGCVVSYRTLHRFATQRCGYRVKESTVRVNDGEPGAELQVDFALMGYLTDADGRRQKVRALILIAVYLRHLLRTPGGGGPGRFLTPPRQRCNDEKRAPTQCEQPVGQRALGEPGDGQQAAEEQK